jgi:hypothetical protein
LGAEVIRLIEIARFIRRRQHDYRHVIEGVLTAYPPQHVEAVHAWHPDVEETRERQGRAPENLDEGVDHVFAAG